MANTPEKKPQLRNYAYAYVLPKVEKQIPDELPTLPPNRVRPEPVPVPKPPPLISGHILGSGLNPLVAGIEIVGNGTITSAASGSYGFNVALGFHGATIPHFGSAGSFVPASYNYVGVTTDLPNQDFIFYSSAPPAPLLISGTVTENGTGIIAGIEIVGVGTITSAASGSYGFDVAAGFNGATIPHFGSAGSFSPAGYTYVTVATDQPNQNFAFHPTLPPLLISGTVTENGTGIVAGIEIVGNGTITTSAAGSYGFNVASGFSGQTRPHVAGNGAFSPAQYTYASILSGQSNQNYDFTPNLDCPVPPTLAALTINGTASPYVMALRPANHEFFVIDTDNQTAYFVDSLTNTLVETVSTGTAFGAEWMVYDSFNDQFVVLDADGNIIFFNPVTRSEIGRILRAVRFTSSGLLAANPANGEIYAISYRDTDVITGKMRVIDGATRTITSSTQMPVAADFITWCPNINRVFITHGNLGGALYTLFNPVNQTFVASAQTADTNFQHECWFHEPTGYVLQSRDGGANPSRIVNVVNDTTVGFIEPSRLASVVVNSCTGETWATDGAQKIFELAANFSTVHIFSVHPNSLGFDRRTNLVYFDDYQTKEIATLASESGGTNHVAMFGTAALANSPVPMLDTDISFYDGVNVIDVFANANGTYLFESLFDFTGVATPFFSGGDFDPLTRSYIQAAGTLVHQNYNFTPTQLVIEPLGGNNVTCDSATNAAGGGYYTPLGPIIITEQAVDDISTGTNQTFVLTAPSGWQFKSATGSLWFAPGGDITSGSVLVSTGTITVTLTVIDSVNIDQFAVYGVEVRPDDGTLDPNAGFILNLSGNPGTIVINGVQQDLTTFGQLNTVPGAVTHMQLLQQPSATAAAGVAFGQQPEVDTFDQFNNQCYLDYATIINVGSTGGGTVTGDTTETVLGGDITFSSLAYTGAGTFKLTFSAAGLSTIQSNNVVVS